MPDRRQARQRREMLSLKVPGRVRHAGHLNNRRQEVTIPREACNMRLHSASWHEKRPCVAFKHEATMHLHVSQRGEAAAARIAKNQALTRIECRGETTWRATR